MKFDPRVKGWLFIAALAFDVVLCVLPLVSPFVGLGLRDDFVLNRWFGIARTESVFLGMVLFGLLVTAFWWTTLRHAGSLPPDSGSLIGRLCRSYRLEAPPPPALWPGHDRTVLLLLAIALQAVYLAAIPLGFECDAANFYDFAKGIVGLGDTFSAYRPPAFPLFLIFTGTAVANTFAVTLLAQAAMGVAIPLMIYRCLQGLGRGPAWIGALAVMLSTTPFTGAKLILSEQLYAFLTLLTVLFLAHYQDRRDPRSIYAFLAAGLGAMLTRWEAEFIVIFGGLAILLIAFRQKRQLRHGVLGVMLALLVLGGYSTARALLIGDVRLIGTLQSGTGMQLFDRLYTMRPSMAAGTASHILGTQAKPDTVVQFESPENGPASRRLGDVIVGYARQRPESYRSWKGNLKTLITEKDAPPEGPYEELFGRFDGDPEALADNIFHSEANLRTDQYPFYVAGAAQHELGLKAGDRLLLGADIEAIRAHPETLLAMMVQGFTLTGLSIEAAADLVRNPLSLANWRGLFPIWEIFAYSRVPFDAGGCASRSLTPHMMAEYRLDQRLTRSAFADRAIELSAFGRNLVRAVCGAILVLGWWLLFLSPRRSFNLPVLLALGSLILVIGVFVGGGNSKYDLAFMPLMVLAAVSIVSEAARRTEWLIRRAGATRS